LVGLIVELVVVLLVAVVELDVVLVVELVVVLLVAVVELDVVLVVELVVHLSLFFQNEVQVLIETYLLVFF